MYYQQTETKGKFYQHQNHQSATIWKDNHMHGPRLSMKAKNVIELDYDEFTDSKIRTDPGIQQKI